jgi:transposase, IS5 family
MRKTINKQGALMPPPIPHQHAKELQAIGHILDQHPQILDLVLHDLTRHLKNPSKGRPGLSADQVLRIFILKQMESLSYEQLAFHLHDSTTYRYFCRLSFADHFNAKSLQQNLKRLTASTLEHVNRILLQHAQNNGVEKGRKVRFDSTVVESNIHAPTDNSLLYDTIRVLARLMGRLPAGVSVGFSDHTRRAKRRHIAIGNAKGRVERNALYCDLFKITRKTFSAAKKLTKQYKSPSHGAEVPQLLNQIRHYLELGKKVLSQAERRVLGAERVPVEDKVVSIFEEHTDIIVKDRRQTYYGHKINLATGASGLILDCIVEQGNPADSQRAVTLVERQEGIFGQCPRQVCFDGGYASRRNVFELKDLGVKDVSFSKRCGLKINEMVKSAWVYKKLKRFRAGIEAGISYFKRCFGLNRCTWRSLESFRSYVWGSVVSANLLMLARHNLN